MGKFIDSILQSACILKVVLLFVIKYIFFDFWKNTISRFYICPLKGHDWYFIGGGWLFSPPSFQCKRCGKYANKID
ncbi:hypothetical protein ABEY43_07160 [Priestia megaterium]